MENKDFIYFRNEDVLNKVDIDPRLVDSFERVMKKIQEYFNANGYTTERNYGAFLKKYLLESGENNFRFYINKIEKKGLLGFYNKKSNKICINEELLTSSLEKLDSTMCHELIHMLVMHDLEKEKAETEIYNGGFINEALTEMLTQQIYPNSNFYAPQVAMQKFANLLSGKVNNYGRFLKGFVDARYSSHDWTNYVRATRAFQEDFHQQGHLNLVAAQNNKNFIEAQRRLISLFIKPNDSKSFEEYCNVIKILIDRPVKDFEFIDKVIFTLDQQMIKEIGVNSVEINSILLRKLAEVRETLKEQEKYEGRNIFEFDFEGRTIGIDESLSVYGNLVNVHRGWDPNEKTLTFQANGKKVVLEVENIDFNARNNMINKKLMNLSSLFGKISSTNLGMLRKALQQNGDVIKIEKFKLPMLDFDRKQKPYYVFVATYADKIVVLNDCQQVVACKEITLNKFIGMTSRNPVTSVILRDKIGAINEGIIYTTLSDKQLEVKAIKEIADDLEKSISTTELTEAINSYKSGDQHLYAVKKENTLKTLAKKRLQSMSNLEREELLFKLKNKSDRFVLSMKDKSINISALQGNEILSAYESTCETLYDPTKNCCFNEVFYELKKGFTIPKINDRDGISFNSDGTLRISNVLKANNIEEEKRKSNLFQIEQMTGKKITVTSGYLLENGRYNDVPLVELKNKSQLRKEQVEISMKIYDLWMDGKINTKKRTDMILTLIQEYNKMVEKAPQPNLKDVFNSDGEFEQNQEQSPGYNHSQQSSQTKQLPIINPNITEQKNKEQEIKATEHQKLLELEQRNTIEEDYETPGKRKVRSK